MKNKYNIIVSLMYLCFTFLFLVNSFKISGAVWGEIIICTLFQYCIITLFIYSGRDKSTRITYFFSGAAVLLVLCFLFRRKVFEIIINIFNMFIECINNFTAAVNTSSAISYNKITLLIITAVILIVTIVYFMVSIKLEMAVSIILCVLLGVMYRFGYKKSVTSFTMIFIILNFVIVAIKNNIKVNKSSDYKKKIISITFVIIITCLITNVVPKSYSGIEKITFAGIMFGNEKKVIGYDDLSKKLGGSLELNTDVAFEYSFPFGVSDGITYFRGQTYDLYNGKEWKKSNFQNNIDSKDYKKKFSEIDKKYVDYVDIYPKNIKANTFLAPEQSYYVKKSDGSSSKIDEHNKVFDNGLKVSGNYRVEFIDKSITKNLEEGNVNSIGNTEDENKEYRDSIKQYENFINVYDELKDSSVNEEQYLSVSSTVPSSVKKQLEEILSDAEGNFEDYNLSDHDKVTAIYRYICNRCSYDLNASNLPKDRDFVDFFLNKDKKGYCMHFATACVILCRMEGIPARLVTGFKETMKGKKPGEKYSVINNQAHAWCEVFMRDNTAANIGKHWVTVDPTPDKDGICEGIESTIISNNSLDDISNTETNEVTYSSKNYHSETDFDEKQSRAKQILDEESSSNSSAQQKLNKKLFIPPAVISLFVTLRSLIIILKYHRLKNKGSNIKIASAMMKLLGFIGYKKQDAETELEFSDRLDDYYLKQDVIRVINLCNAEYYGDKKNTTEGYMLLLSIKRRIKEKIGLELYIKEIFLFW